MRHPSLLLLASVLLCAPAAQALAEPTLVGIWFSPFQPDEPDVMSVIEFNGDGTFREEFRKCEKGDYIGYQSESGTWKVDGEIEHMIADEINGEATKVEGTYTILMLTETERRIRMDPQGYVFVGHRVSKFEFPSCATGT